MEMYFDPSESAIVGRDAVLRGFSDAGLGASAKAEGKVLGGDLRGLTRLRTASLKVAC